jgi:hypothetical protein
MPFRTSHEKRQHFSVLAQDQPLVQTTNREFDRSYLAIDADYMYVLDEGVVVAVDSTTSKYVPYSAGASYGTGSDTAVGITTMHYDMTYGAKFIAPAIQAVLLEDYCQIYGSGRGSISAAVKTALPLLMWRS